MSPYEPNQAQENQIPRLANDLCTKTPKRIKISPLESNLWQNLLFRYSRSRNINLPSAEHRRTHTVKFLAQVEPIRNAWDNHARTHPLSRQLHQRTCRRISGGTRTQDIPRTQEGPGLHQRTGNRLTRRDGVWSPNSAKVAESQQLENIIAYAITISHTQIKQEERKQEQSEEWFRKK